MGIIICRRWNSFNYNITKIKVEVKNMKKEKGLEKISFGIAIMFGIYWIYSIFIQDKINIPSILKTII